MADEPRRFTIVYAPLTKQHLRAIEAKYYSLIRDIVDEQLSFEPTTETRNRKPLNAQWCLWQHGKSGLVHRTDSVCIMMSIWTRRSFRSSRSVSNAAIRL